MSIFSERKVVTRFAPSPTGFMHVGGARTALYAYLWARKNKGTFILRIEDTDREREVAGSIEHIMDSLSWLGIEWDYGPNKMGPFGSCIQSERRDTYLAYAHKLVERGFAYQDPYTTDELAVLRDEAKAQNRPFLFREHRPDGPCTWDGVSTLRFKVPKVERSEWVDEVRGNMTAGEEALDDFVLMKSDGYPTYNFAHIVDDAEMEVTHIMRSDEFISSTPRFLSLYKALGITPPKFVTLPPILRDDKTKKLGKRDGAKDLLEYRDDGYTRDALVNFLALIGWNPGTDQEIFSHDELIAQFSIEGIQSAGGLLNEDKLRWINREHLLRMSDIEFLTYISPYLAPRVQALPQFNRDRLGRLLPAIRERIHVGKELLEQCEAGEYDFAFAAPVHDPASIKWKNDTSPRDALSRLRTVAELIAAMPEIVSPEEAKERIFPYAEEAGKGEVLWPLRVALTGREKSPDPFTVIHILGTAESYNRIRTACDTILQTG